MRSFSAVSTVVSYALVRLVFSRSHSSIKGDARYAWTELKRKFEPKTGFSKVKLKRDFNSCCLEDGKDPDAWINCLTVIKRGLETLGMKLSERDLMIHILGTLPKTNKTSVDMAEKDLTEGTLTIEKLKEMLRMKFEKVKVASNIDLALFLKQFKGSCNVCGKIGHKAEDCFKLEKNKGEKETFEKQFKNKNYNKKKKIQCFKCKKFGHYKSDCLMNTRSNVANNDDLKLRKTYG